VISGERGGRVPAREERQQTRTEESSAVVSKPEDGTPELCKARRVSELLAVAADQVVRADDARLVLSGTGLRSHLHLLCLGAIEAHSGRTAPVHGLSAAAPLRAMIDALRREVLAERSRRELDPRDALTAVEALDAMMRVIESDNAIRFTEHLAGRQGLDLLVEVTHDLRSPLGSILFLAEALRRGHSGTINAVQERQLGLIYSAAFGLSSLSSDLMELARGGDRLVDTEPVSFSVASIFRSVRDIVQPMAEEKGLEIRITPPEGDFRLGHPSALNRVLLNLTTNSLKFTATGYVEVSGRQLSRKTIEFSVRDTGRGIPDEVISSLFEAFRKRESTGDYLFSSAGLGLAICRRLVAAMGSELQVQTAPDYGTRFYFTLDLPAPPRM
jgi:signal transduction histidine kinase